MTIEFRFTGFLPVVCAATLLASIACRADVEFVEASPSPHHPPVAPTAGVTVSVNPPPMIWPHDSRAKTYRLELSTSARFQEPEIVLNGIDLPFYNHLATLAVGTWHWRYFVKTGEGLTLGPSPVRSFRVPDDAVEIPVPSTRQLLDNLPDHPRVFTNPESLASFRERRNGEAREAWKEVEWRAQRELRHQPQRPNDLKTLEERPPEGPTPGREGSWVKADGIRRQVIWLLNGGTYGSREYGHRELNRDAERANVLSYAYLISGDEVYARAAKQWLLFLADTRMDYHLEDRAHHNTVVYSYEEGLKMAALTYDRIYHHLSSEERSAVQDHVRHHAEAAYAWLRDRARIHLNYQVSHPQQCMHALFTTVLAVANDIPEAEEWLDYLVRQYVNRIAWTSEDGGYFEGQTYGHKFRWILEALLATRTALGIDLFQAPHIDNSGDFWLYCMSLNYWFHHGGDVYSLLWPWGHPADVYITNWMASITQNPYVQWWSDTVFADPVQIPFQFLSDTGQKRIPPVDIPQARAFRETGQVAAYDRFYDHLSDRIFFRSSQWGGHSHAHADQNNFVIHSGGEILAADTGYYTYWGDDYHVNWTKTTRTHNSVLIDGEGQPEGIAYKGEITEFFHSPDYTFFTGDASKAYRTPLQGFERGILFVRPGIYVVYDELSASKPSEFSWLLNTFEEARIDEAKRSMTVSQQEQRLRVRHLLPEDVRYEQSNERRYPIQTREWSRYTEAFPEPWHIQVTTGQEKTDHRFLVLMNTFEAEEGDSLSEITRVENNNTLGLRFVDQIDSLERTVLFRRDLRQHREIADDATESDGLMATLARHPQEGVRSWMTVGSSFLRSGNATLLRAEKPVDAYGAFSPADCRALFWITSSTRQSLRLHVGSQPARVLFSPRHRPEDAQEMPFTWEGESIVVDWPSGVDGVLRVDPVIDPRHAPPDGVLAVDNGEERYDVPLRTMVTENGEWVAFAEIDPRNPGFYRIESSDDDARLLIQDRWDLRRGSRGVGHVTGILREKTELYFRVRPGGDMPRFQAYLIGTDSAVVNNLLRNGDFEEGIPQYPPRGWTVIRDARSPDLGWPGWSQEKSFSGASSLRIFRPNDRVVARSQPMRLVSEGAYRLRFRAKGDATHSEVRVSGSRGTSGSVSIEPSDDWREYQLETNLMPGYCTLFIDVNPGGEPDQVLWVDGMEFGPIR